MFRRQCAQVPSVAEDAEKWAPVLKRICWYAVLAPASSDQVTLLTTTAADKKLLELPAYKELLQTFITKEVQPCRSFTLSPRMSACHEPKALSVAGTCQQMHKALSCSCTRNVLGLVCIKF